MHQWQKFGENPSTDTGDIAETWKSGMHSVMPWPWTLTFWPQNLISSSLSRDAPVTKIWRKSVNKYWRYRGNKTTTWNTDGRTHGRTHSREFKPLPRIFMLYSRLCIRIAIANEDTVKKFRDPYHDPNPGILDLDHVPHRYQNRHRNVIRLFLG